MGSSPHSPCPQVKKRCKWLYEFSKELAKLPGTPDDPFSGTLVDINAMGENLVRVTSSLDWIPSGRPFPGIVSSLIVNAPSP